jgi:ABC-type uncharacterized transport system permease subunit
MRWREKNDGPPSHPTRGSIRACLLCVGIAVSFALVGVGVALAATGISRPAGFAFGGAGAFGALASFGQVIRFLSGARNERRNAGAFVCGVACGLAMVMLGFLFTIISDHPDGGYVCIGVGLAVSAIAIVFLIHSLCFSSSAPEETEYFSDRFTSLDISKPPRAERPVLLALGIVVCVFLAPWLPFLVLVLFSLFT